MDNNRNNAFSEKLKEQVTKSFDRIRKALDLREKLLLRQLSVVVHQSHHVTYQFDNIKFVDIGEEDLIGKIRTYGKYNIDNFNIILKDHYENEDYILPVDDHDLMHKTCRKGIGEEERENPESEEIVVEFFNNRSLIKEGAEMVRESIINLALNESKELIDSSFNANVGLDLKDELERAKINVTNTRNRAMCATSSVPIQDGDDEEAVDNSINNNINQGEESGIDNSMIIAKQYQMFTKASQTDLEKNGRYNGSASSNSGTEFSQLVRKSDHVENKMQNISNLTMNNFGGTINLKNVTNLTINACPDTPVSKQETKPTIPRCPSEEGSPECGFYKRLITENKILRQHILQASIANVSPKALNLNCSDSVTDTESSTSSPNADNSASTSGSKSQTLPMTVAELRAVLNLPQPDDNLTKVLGNLFTLASPMSNAAGQDPAEHTSQEHTTQIQQWLKQIMSETETEPLQNAELLEFSRFNT
ncbi:uncharacterized protein LOC129767413 [Toxorhynchites rutilus septentrionalis]|uniref:uncharacterized protein LOC129767413 n=1 Tax=Toxorhynchites rutilus septentrionalis TaxID=329112 RepID=UPI002478FD49|nr:uncharacterized protein LOC129767413 [Toxorhynchites rutilus septentrionalis]